MIKPIKPDEVSFKIPDSIIAIFNKFISDKWDGKRSFILQDEIVEYIVNHTQFQRNEIFENQYLNIEDIYKSIGWIVDYLKPTYTETWKPFFEFRKKEQ